MGVHPAPLHPNVFSMDGRPGDAYLMGMNTVTEWVAKRDFNYPNLQVKAGARLPDRFQHPEVVKNLMERFGKDAVERREVNPFTPHVPQMFKEPEPKGTGGAPAPPEAGEEEMAPNPPAGGDRSSKTQRRGQRPS